MKEGCVPLAWLNNKLAIELVESGSAQVFAQMVRLDDSLGYRSVPLARKDGKVQMLQDVVARPGLLRFGQGTANPRRASSRRTTTCSRRARSVPRSTSSR